MHRRQRRWEQFRFAVAALLITATAAKIFSIPQILEGGGLLGTVPRLVTATAIEAAVAVYLIIGNRYLSWLMTLITFLVLVISAVYAMATDQSCNCFGERLDAEAMVIIDTVVLLLTGCLRPETVNLSKEKLLQHLTIVAAAAAIIAGIAYWRYDDVLTNNRARFLVVNQLLGETWPLNGELNAELSVLSSGKWMILIALTDCGHCREMVARYFSDPTAHRPGERTAVFVFGRDGEPWRFLFDEVTLDVLNGSLLSWPHGEPHVVNPAIFLVNDGIVVDAAEGTATEPFMESLMSHNEPSTP